MTWYLRCLKRYADFSGRAHPGEYWNFVLVQMMASLVALFLFMLGGDESVLGYIMLGVAVTYFVATMIPQIAVSVRRLHDMNLSGWWFLINFLPVGQIVFIFMMIIPGTDRRNRFGDIPVR